MHKLLKAISLAAGGLALSGAIASAEVVCNEDGDCWRVKERYEYKPDLKLRVYPNDWRWSETEKDRYRWRDIPSGKAERGYWRQGVWVDIN